MFQHPTQGKIDLVALLRYLSREQKSEILDKIDDIKQQEDTLKAFAATLCLGTNKEWLRLSNEYLSAMSLAALDLGLVNEAQVYTLHIQIAVLIEFFQFRHKFYGRYATSGIEVEPFMGDIASQVEIYHYSFTDNKDSSNGVPREIRNILRWFFGMTLMEWDYFASLMSKAPASEQYFYVYEVHCHVHSNPALNENQRLMSSFYLWTRNNTQYLIVPSFTMLQNRLRALANHFGVKECMQLQPLFGDVTEADIERLKASGRIQFPLPCPLAAPSERMAQKQYYFKVFHGFSECGPLSFAWHDYYHAWKETWTHPSHRDAQYYMMNLLREYVSMLDHKQDLNVRVSRYITKLIQYIIDGDETQPTVKTPHPIFINRSLTETSFVYTFDYMLNQIIGPLGLYPEDRALMEAPWQFMRDKYHAYQAVNPGNDWQDNFNIDPERDLVINKFNRIGM